MRIAPPVSEEQAKLLRLARDGGIVRRAELRDPRSYDSCVRHGWLSGLRGEATLTPYGQQALTYFDHCGR